MPALKDKTIDCFEENDCGSSTGDVVGGYLYLLRVENVRSIGVSIFIDSLDVSSENVGDFECLDVVSVELHNRMIVKDPGNFQSTLR